MLPREHTDVTFSVITNWSSLPSVALAEEMGSDDGHWSNNENIQLLRHLLIVYPKCMLVTPPKQTSFLVIFSSGPNDLGCVLLMSGHLMDEIGSCRILRDDSRVLDRNRVA